MFNDYPLSERVQRALAQQGFSEPTPIQAASLEHTLAGRDFLGQARTGTGKTLAFGLPIATRLEKDKTRGRAPRALIVTPTRELALQVSRELTWVAPHLNVITVYGGTGYGKQAADLKRGCDVVVATPGRALDYLERGILKLDAVELAVLDEADEMLSMGFEKDVETLLAATPTARQTLLFSATLPKWAQRLAREHLRDPVHANLIEEEEVSYREISIEIALKNRMAVLSDLLHAHQGEKAIIFTHTKAEVDRLARDLSARGQAAEAIHGDLNQTQRERVLARFRSGQVSALVGTNVAARGLDIPEVDLVVHYRLPNETEAYQHRSGRTGRAGRSGTVIVLHGPKERRELNIIERAVGRRFERQSPPTPEKIQASKLSHLFERASEQPAQDKALWQKAARELIASGDSDRLAGLLAVVLGGAPQTRSLLTGDEGWVTLELAGDFRNPGQVMRKLKDAGAGEVGRIALGQREAYADVRTVESERLLGQASIQKAQTVRAQSKPSRAQRASSMRPRRPRSARTP